VAASRPVGAELARPLAADAPDRVEVVSRLVAGLLTAAIVVIVPEAPLPARTMTSTASAVTGLSIGTGVVALLPLMETIVRCAKVYLLRVYLP